MHCSSKRSYHAAVPQQTIENTDKSPRGRGCPKLCGLLAGQRILTLLTTWQNKLIHTLQDRFVCDKFIGKKNHKFEDVLTGFEDFQKQAEKKLISFQTCGSKRVEK